MTRAISKEALTGLFDVIAEELRNAGISQAKDGDIITSANIRDAVFYTAYRAYQQGLKDGRAKSRSK